MSSPTIPATIALASSPSGGGSGWVCATSVKVRQHLAPERFDPFLLVTAHVMQVDAAETHVDELLDRPAVGIQVGCDQHPTFEILRTDDLSHQGEVAW